MQQILLLASRHYDFADPDLSTNGAGFRVSHNVGFGVPDAGVAVELARRWTNRPPLTNVTVTSNDPLAIPDDGLRVLVTGNDVPQNLASIHTLPSTGPHADTPTATLALVDFGFGTAPVASIHEQSSLIQRHKHFRGQINLLLAGASRRHLQLSQQRQAATSFCRWGRLIPVPTLPCSSATATVKRSNFVRNQRLGTGPTSCTDQPASL